MFLLRYISEKLVDIPIFLIQPCYLDLWKAISQRV